MQTLIRVRVPAFVSADYLEDLHHELGSSNARDVEFDLSEFEGCRLFGEARLLGLLISAKRRMPKIRITVPIKDFLRDYAPSDTSKYWRLFQSTTGLILANLSDAMPDRSSKDCISYVRQWQARKLDSNHGVMLYCQKELVAPLFHEIPGPATADLYREERISGFDSCFRRLLFGDLGLPKLDDRNVEGVTTFAFETLQNARQHASEDLKGDSIDGLIFLSIRKIDLRMQSLKDLVGEGDQNPVSSYIQALDKESVDSFAKPKELVEITVADSGVGIPARMFRSMGIYAADRDLERKQLQVALTPTGTSKPPSIPGAGLGLYKAMEATHKLKGMILFRTGRMLQYKYYLAGASTWPDVVPLDWKETSTHPIAGTAVSLILPWQEAGQSSLAFDWSNGAQPIR